MNPIADIESRGSFLNDLDVVKLNIYLNAMGAKSRIFNGTETDEYMYATVQMMIRLNSSGSCVPFAGELDSIIEKCNKWKDEKDFYEALDDILGEE